jgi:hypothetical protein
MNEILDQTSDINGQLTYRLTTLFPPPDFVKNASTEAIHGTSEELPLRCYGDPASRLYPCNTKEATWVSMLFFLNNKLEDLYTTKHAQVIEERIDNLAKYWDISTHTDALKERVKVASTNPLFSLPNDEFALIIAHKDGVVERHYPLRNTLEVVKAAEYLDQFKDIIPLADRQKMAQRILEKADKHGAGLTDSQTTFLERQAGYGVCAAKDAADLIMSRVSILGRMNKDAEVRTELKAAAKACLDNAEYVRQPSALTKLAGIIDNIDRQYGFHRDYSDSFPRPEDVLFGVTVKAAQSILEDHCALTTGKIYKIADFRKLPLEDIRDTMGDSFADEVSAGGLTTSPDKLADIASTLPRPDAEVLDRLLVEAGVTPVAKEAAHYDVGIGKTQLHDLAALR